MKPTQRPSFTLVTETCSNECSFPHKWWSALKSAVSGSSSSSPPLVSEGGGLVCESVGKADMLLDQASSPGMLLICHSLAIHLLVLPPLTFAFRSREVRCLLLDLDPYGGTDLLGMFPFFLRELLMLWPPVLV